MAGSGDLLPVVGMVSFQVVFAGLNIFYKLAVSDGMDLRVLVAYRYMFASAFITPLAYFVERWIGDLLLFCILLISSLY